VPEPIEANQRYVAGLDGIRALAVLCVIAYHVNAPWARGGMLGVGVFFTLSGYLITDLLLDRWRRWGDLALANFWLRRARRLLPALFLMLAAVSIWVAFFDTSQLAGVRRQVIAAVLYFNNWSTIAQHGSYFARFAAPLPLDHLWSLAIEEQFYLIWPWLLLAGVKFVRGRRQLALLALVGAVISAVVMGLLYHPGFDPTRAYEGTDTRAFGLLLGAAVAIALPVDRRPGNGVSRPVPADVRNLLDLLGIAGLGCVLVLVWRTDPFSSFLYPYGFVLLSLASAALIVAAVESTSHLGRALGWEPLRWIGVRSYGIYLWQWPIVALASPHQTTFSLSRSILEVGATVIVASLSWRYVEQPIRHGALGRLWQQARAQLVVRRRVLRLSGATLAGALLSVLGLGGALPAVSASLASPNGDRILRIPRTETLAVDPSDSLQNVPAFFRPTRTSCSSAVYIGDSTSGGETSTNYIPNAGQRLPEQLADVGVRVTYPEISAARSIVETFEGHPNAVTVAQQHEADGFRGCWILALGTNEAANVYAHSPYDFDVRIARMMAAARGQPVLWIDAVTLVRSGPYAEAGMVRWNRALLAACQRYPNLRVFDWASDAKPRWFIPDGIHYYTPGYIARSHLIARSMLKAFPAGAAPSTSCLVR
jgi:peptidoglycan/LPS O-acetylase OafA/YrhL